MTATLVDATTVDILMYFFMDFIARIRTAMQLRPLTYTDLNGL